MHLNYADLEGRWIALQVKAGWELKSALALRERGYEEFVPTYWHKREWSDRTKVVQRPLFTGYIFLRFITRFQHKIISVPGVLRFVGTGHCPSSIDDSEIQALQIACRAHSQFLPTTFIDIGQPVTVHSGPLRGLQGKVVRFKKTDRLILSVALLKLSVFVEVDRALVSALPPAIPSLDTAYEQSTGVI